MHAMKGRCVDTSRSTDTDQFTQTFNNVEVTQVSNKCLHAVSTRGDAFTTVDIRCPQMKHTRYLRLKIDTGAQGNALPIRTFKQMYGNTEPTKILTPIGQTTLTASAKLHLRHTLGKESNVLAALHSRAEVASPNG